METRDSSMWERILDALERGDPEELAILRRECSEATVDEASRLLDAFSLAAAAPGQKLVEGTLARILEEFTEARGARIGRWVGARWAELIADSLRPSPAVRGGTGSSDRTLVYRVRDQTISVSFSSSTVTEGSVRVRGSVLSGGGPFTAGSVTVFRGDDSLDAVECDTCPIDSWGAFGLEMSREDRAYLEVRTAEGVVLVGPIPPPGPE